MRLPCHNYRRGLVAFVIVLGFGVQAIPGSTGVSLAQPAPALSPTATSSPAPVPPSSASTTTVAQGDQGLNVGWAIDDAGHVNFLHSLSSSLGFAHDGGAGWVRVAFRLGACYPNWTVVGCDGRTALQAYDEVLTKVRSQNLRVLGIVTAESWAGTQTDWTANNAETAGGNGDNPFVQAFAQQAAGVLANHFAAQVGDWEVWNEPNAWTSTDNLGHFFGSSFLYPSNYAWLLQRSYAAIKSAQPSSRVAFAGLFAHQPFGVRTAVLVNGKVEHVVKRGDMPGARRPPLRGEVPTVCASHTPSGSDSGASYLCATYRVGLGFANWAAAAYPLDDVGQHLYLGLGAAIDPTTIATYLQDLRQAYVAYEGPGTAKRTLVTEVGWPTDQVSLQMQSDDLRVAFQTLRATSYVARSFWFNTQDVPEAGLYYGLVDTDGIAKLAFGAYQQYATNQTPTATPTSTPTATATATRTATATAVPAAAPMQAIAAPQRLVDTRVAGGPIAAGSARCFVVAGSGSIPADASSVVLNVAAVGYSGIGWLTLYPNGQAVPGTSTLNFDPHEYAIANGAITKVGSGGQVCVNASGSASDVILDVTGFVSGAGAASVAMLGSPQRLVDTRLAGGALAAGTSRCFAIGGLGGVPADAAAVILNVTAIGYAGLGWLTLYANGQAVPATSTLNFDPHEYAIANGAIVKLGTSGQVCVNAGNNASHIILDVTGLVSSAGLAQVPTLATPQRLVDTRLSGGPIAAGSTSCFAVAGHGGIPANATAVILNVTAVGYSTLGWLTLYPNGQAVPGTSTLNFDPSEYAIADGAIIKLGTGGQVCVSAGNSASSVILDATGYLAP